jgi:hypothetical protein
MSSPSKSHRIQAPKQEDIPPPQAKQKRNLSVSANRELKKTQAKPPPTLDGYGQVSTPGAICLQNLPGCLGTVTPATGAPTALAHARPQRELLFSPASPPATPFRENLVLNPKQEEKSRPAVRHKRRRAAEQEYGDESEQVAFNYNYNPSFQTDDSEQVAL